MGLLKTCRELGITVVAYSPLGRGLLTGAYVRGPIYTQYGIALIVTLFTEIQRRLS